MKDYRFKFDPQTGVFCGIQRLKDGETLWPHNTTEAEPHFDIDHKSVWDGNIGFWKLVPRDVFWQQYANIDVVIDADRTVLREIKAYRDEQQAFNKYLMGTIDEFRQKSGMRDEKVIEEINNLGNLIESDISLLASNCRATHGLVENLPHPNILVRMWRGIVRLLRSEEN